MPYAVIDIYVDRSLYTRDPGRFDTEMVILVLESIPDVEINSARQTLAPCGVAAGAQQRDLSWNGFAGISPARPWRPSV